MPSNRVKDTNRIYRNKVTYTRPYTRHDIERGIAKKGDTYEEVITYGFYTYKYRYQPWNQLKAVVEVQELVSESNELKWVTVEEKVFERDSEER